MEPVIRAWLLPGEIKSLSAEGIITGYAATWHNVDHQGETIVPGAFSETIDDFVKAGHLCYQHDWSKLIGSIESAHEDDHGLFFKARFFTTALAQETKRIVMERLERGKSVALSIGYNVIKDMFRKDGVRELRKLKLFEVSLVSIAANPLAMVASVKSILPWQTDLEEQRQMIKSLLSTNYAGITDGHATFVQQMFLEDQVAEQERLLVADYESRLTR